MLDNIILIGGGGHCKSCIDVIETQNKFKIAGIVDNKNTKVLGYEVIGKDSDLNTLQRKSKYAFVTIGQIKDYKKRLNIFNKLNKLKFIIPIIISPFAQVSSKSKIGVGTIIMHNSIVGPSVKIGSNCIINNKSLIEHDSKIGDNSHISTGAIINGNVVVGKNCFIGSGVVVKNNVTIGDNVIIGASYYVDKDIKNNKLLKI